MCAALPPSSSIFESPVDELLHPELAIWRENVGQPIALDLAPPGPKRVVGLDVLCWNVAIGAGRLIELLGRMFDGELEGAGTDARRPLVVLLQEAYRSDETVPAGTRGGYHGGAKHARVADDVADVARAFNLSLRYAPSMRNGAHRSDRGNAILSGLPIGLAHAFVLPHVRQRRVVVSAELDGIENLALMSAHLDVRGRLRAMDAEPDAAHRRGWRRVVGADARELSRFAGGRVAQATALIERIADRAGDHCLILGADLNAHLGVRDPVVRALANAGLRRGTRTGSWRHTFHGVVRLELDHVLFRSPPGRIERVRVNRIDEHPGDAGRRVFGSDHHPLLARVDFATPIERRVRDEPVEP